MEVRAQDIVDSVDLSKSEAFLPLYESIVNSRQWQGASDISI